MDTVVYIDAQNVHKSLEYYHDRTSAQKMIIDIAPMRNKLQKE